MSRGILIIGVLLSAAAHAWLLTLPPRATPAPVTVVPVVETEMLRPDPAETPEPPRPEPPVKRETPPEPPPPESAPPEKAPPEDDPTPPPPPPPAPKPQPRLELTAQARKTDAPERGDFAGDAAGRWTPQLRIDWGSEQQAVNVLETGAMKIVVLDGGAPSPTIIHQVERDGDAWTLGPYRPDPVTRFSNRLRIVDDVPAFDGARRARGLRGTERLAVLVPTPVERMLESAQLQAAFEHGLAMESVRNFGGRFTLDGRQLAFSITELERMPPRRESR